MKIINEVAGFDLARYNTRPILDVISLPPDDLQTENIRYSLKSDRDSIEILETFNNGRLKMIEVLENTDSCRQLLSPNVFVGMAKTFLHNYQTYSGNSFYEQLSSMLNMVDATKNSTKTFGNIKFDITTTLGNSPLRDSTTFTWSFISNGINTLDKCVSLGYRDGFFKHFIDTWDLHKIGSTTINLSEQQAERIAMKNAKTYAWTIGSGNESIVINNFDVTKPIVKELIFGQVGNADNARDSDQLALYPMWHIGVGLDKYYPGNVYGIYVDIWADSGEIKKIYEVSSSWLAAANDTATIAESSINYNAPIIVDLTSSLAILMPFSFILIVLMGALSLALFTKKKRILYLNLPRLNRTGTKVICILLGSFILLSLALAVPTANAAVANIWGETSAGTPYLYHTHTEIDLQHDLAGYLDTWFMNAGYAHNVFNNHQTTKENVLDYTSYHGQVYPSVETVYFDHGIGLKGGYGLSDPDEWHYMLCTDYSILSNPEQMVFDYQMHGATSTNNYHFSYISTCMSGALYDGDEFGGTGTYGENQGGTGNIIGMPYAWTHGASLSENGFSSPDTGKYIYIGFDYGSPSLSQCVDNRPSGGTIYYVFVYHFFDGLLNLDLTVNQALNHAAYAAFPPETFAGTALYQGFDAYWPGCNPEVGPGRMVVYGNGNIYLYPGGPDYVTTPSISGPTSGTINNEYQFSASATDPYGYPLTFTFNWGDGSEPEVITNPSSVCHTWTSANAYTISVTAQSQNGVYSSTSYHSIDISNPYPVYHYLTVEAYGEYIGWGFPLYPNVWIDGIYYGTAPVTAYVLEGWHDIEVDYWTWNPYFYCDSYFDYMWYDDGYIGYGYGTYVPVYHDQSATAWYIP